MTLSSVLHNPLAKERTASAFMVTLDCSTVGHDSVQLIQKWLCIREILLVAGFSVTNFMAVHQGLRMMCSFSTHVVFKLTRK